ncbi:MAG: gamma-glutamyl-gamma-aminobutyrate hydrolase family protein [Bacteroidales bacterium]|nr:gamma-glutamyl-gamma-aminobutyrate hydrolase family protein [Bacteroidales bacterium]
MHKIAISCDINREGRLMLRQEYHRAIVDAGAVPVIVPPLDSDSLDEWLDAVSVAGLLLSGGADVDPALFGEEPVAGLGRVSRQRDDYEIALFRAAERRRIPVLGICRGLQVVNVARGGTLWQDMASQLGEQYACHDQTQATEIGTHEVLIEPGSKVAALFESTRLNTNTHHHQAVKSVGDGLTVSAVAADGTIEALEDSSANIVAVQFHPERMPDMAYFFRNWIKSLV